jgi:hypothetical protein
MHCYLVAHGLPEFNPTPWNFLTVPRRQPQRRHHQEESHCLTNKTSLALLLMFFVKPSVPTIQPVRSTPSARAISAIRFGPSDPGLSDHDLPTPKVDTFWHATFAFEKRGRLLTKFSSVSKGGILVMGHTNSQEDAVFM